MDQDKINLTFPPDYNGKPILIEVREGQAEELNTPISWSQAASVRSILEFVIAKGYKTSTVENPGLILYNIEPETAMITFQHDPTDQRAHRITAKMRKNPDFESFGINRDKYFSQKDLERQIRKYAHCFQDANEAKDFINRLRNFKVKYEQQVEKKDDRQGNTKDLVETAIKFAEGEMPRTLNLRCPLYVHADPVSFTVEVEIQKGSNNMPEFGFYSLDLELKIREVAAETILVNVAALSKYFAALEI